MGDRAFLLLETFDPYGLIQRWVRAAFHKGSIRVTRVLAEFEQMFYSGLQSTGIRTPMQGSPVMSANAISFTYEDRFGQVGEIDLSVMRKLWVDGERAGVVFAEPTADGQETLHEVIVNDRGTTDAMVAVMESLLATPALERVEAPVARPSLLLEFRTRRPHVVALAARS